MFIIILMTKTDIFGFMTRFAVLWDGTQRKNADKYICSDGYY